MGGYFEIGWYIAPIPALNHGTGPEAISILIEKILPWCKTAQYT